MLGSESIEPHADARTGRSLTPWSCYVALLERGASLLSECGEVRGVPLPHCAFLIDRLKPIQRVLSDRFEHEIAIPQPSQKALVQERLQRIECCLTYRSGRLQRAAATEDREPAEELLLVGRQ